MGTSEGVSVAKFVMSTEKNVEAYVRGLRPGQKALVQKLRRLVKAKAPHLVEVMKWGNVCWVGAGNVCLVHVEDDHLDFAFFMGTALPDPARILVGKGKFLRMVKVRKAADIRPRELAAVIGSAVALDRTGPLPKRPTFPRS
jgi:hypothetical protein